MRGLVRTYLAVIQEKNRVFRRDDRFTIVAVDKQTRNVSSHKIRTGSRAAQESKVTGLWLGRDTLSDDHLVGTSAGVMRSRAVRRLQEPAR